MAVVQHMKCFITLQIHVWLEKNDDENFWIFNHICMLLITLEHFENFWYFFYFSHVIFGQTETNYGEKKTNKIVSKLLSVGHRAVVSCWSLHNCPHTLAHFSANSSWRLSSTGADLAQNLDKNKKQITTNRETNSWAVTCSFVLNPEVNSLSANCVIYVHRGALIFSHGDRAVHSGAFLLKPFSVKMSIRCENLELPSFRCNQYSGLPLWRWADRCWWGRLWFHWLIFYRGDKQMFSSAGHWAGSGLIKEEDEVTKHISSVLQLVTTFSHLCSHKAHIYTGQRGRL